MATTTFQYGGYSRFQPVYPENKFGDPHFLFYKTSSYITINYVTHNFVENSFWQNFFKICHIVHCTARNVFLKKNGGNRTYFQGKPLR